MAIFAPDEVDWQRVDYYAIATHGLACIPEVHAKDCRRWLAGRRYRIVEVDCASGFSSVCKRISDLCGWVEQFGYEYQGHSLDALRDGFAFEIPEDGGLVLELERPDILWREHRRWVAGLLEIASEHSRVQLAAGRRFFATLIVPPDAEMIGTTLFDVGVPACWSLPGPQPPFR